MKSAAGADSLRGGRAGGSLDHGLEIINPHQGCRYSDSPFARIHYFYTVGFGNVLEGMETVCPQTRNHQNGSI